MKGNNIIFSTTLVGICISLAESGVPERNVQKCRSLSSCFECLTLSSCSWCISRSTCSYQECNNDNVIYSQNTDAFLAGPEFCPKVAEPTKPIVVKSGSNTAISVRITQIHIHMAFTPWKCKIYLDGKEISVKAVLFSDRVYCESVPLTNESDKPYVSGTVTVLWDNNKAFDGAQPIQVCRCELTPNCEAC